MKKIIIPSGANCIVKQPKNLRLDHQVDIYKLVLKYQIEPYCTIKADIQAISGTLKVRTHSKMFVCDAKIFLFSLSENSVYFSYFGSIITIMTLAGEFVMSVKLSYFDGLLVLKVGGVCW